MKTNGVSTNHHKHNGKANGHAATLEAEPAVAPIPTLADVLESVPVAPAAPMEAAPVADVAPPMATEETTGGDESGGEPEQKTPIVRNLQPERYYVFIGESDNFIKGLAGAGEPMASLLPSYGITPERLAAVIAQLEASQGSIDARTQGMLDESRAVIAMQRAQGQAEIAFTNFRQVGRSVFDDKVSDRDARLALALDLRIPTTIMLFLDKGRSALAFARQEPQITRLAAAGFTTERIDDMLALFDALDMLYDARQVAQQAAKHATRFRDATLRDFERVMRQLRADVSALLRAHPEVDAPTGF